MRFDVLTPCAECPFRRSGRLAVRLSRSRILEITKDLLDPNGSTFSCHKELHGHTTDECEYQPSTRDIHCAGALIFCERQRKGTAEQAENRMRQVARRLGLYDPGQFRSRKQRQLIFATVAEMLKTALPGR